MYIVHIYVNNLYVFIVDSDQMKYIATTRLVFSCFVKNGQFMVVLILCIFVFVCVKILFNLQQKQITNSHFRNTTHFYDLISFLLLTVSCTTYYIVTQGCIQGDTQVNILHYAKISLSIFLIFSLIMDSVICILFSISLKSS